MKRILFVVILAMIMSSCSDDETIDLLQPVIETIILEDVGVGDIVTIPGKDFDENGIYSIKFNDLDGKITEVKSTYLKVEVPKGATSGDITLTYDGITTKIGSIKIKLDISTLYAFKTIEEKESENETSHLIRIDPSDGSETILQTIADVESFYPVYDKVTNRIYAVCGNEGEDDDKLIIYDLSDDTHSTVNLISDNEDQYISYELVVGKEGNLYAFKTIEEKESEDETSHLIKIDPSDGSETILQTITDVESFYPVYDKVTNRIYAVCGNEGEDDDKLIIYGLSDDTHSTVNLISDNEDQYISYELVVGKEGNLYAFKTIEEKESEDETSHLIRIDPSDGSETILQTITDVESFYPVYDKVANRIYAVCGNEGEDDDKLIIYDLSDNTHSTVNLTSDNENQYITYELVIAY